MTHGYGNHRRGEGSCGCGGGARDITEAATHLDAKVAPSKKKQRVVRRFEEKVVGDEGRAVVSGGEKP
jgi:hypothetical protein